MHVRQRLYRGGTDLLRPSGSTGSQGAGGALERHDLDRAERPGARRVVGERLVPDDDHMRRGGKSRARGFRLPLERRQVDGVPAGRRGPALQHLVHAVGSQNPPTGYPVSVTWNGTSWTRQPVSLPSGSEGNFYWVSCGSADACQAVGYYIDATGGVDPLAETWNGTDWSADVIAPLGSGVAGGFDSVSCARSGPCTVLTGRWTNTGTARDGRPTPSRYRPGRRAKT
jgi:hypothetical protein